MYSVSHHPLHLPSERRMCLALAEVCFSLVLAPRPPALLMLMKAPGNMTPSYDDINICLYIDKVPYLDDYDHILKRDDARSTFRF